MLHYLTFTGMKVKNTIVAEVSKKLNDASLLSNSSSQSLSTTPNTVSPDSSEEPVVKIEEELFLSYADTLKGSSHSLKDTSGQGKSWALPLVPIVPKQHYSATLDKLVGVYEMRLCNHQSLQVVTDKSLVQNLNLLQPDFAYLQWMKENASPAIADKSVTLSTDVEKYLDEAEQSLQEHMKAYYSIRRSLKPPTNYGLASNRHFLFLLD